MTMSVQERNSGSGGKEEESEDESEILEESPCGRWQKRKEQVGPYSVVGGIQAIVPFYFAIFIKYEVDSGKH